MISTWKNLRSTAVALTLICLASISQAQVSLCDSLAASRYDHQRNSTIVGVGWEDLDVMRALPACEKAAALNPTNGQILYQYGRVLAKAGRHQEAVRLFTKASAMQHAQSYNALGNAYRFGEGVKRDYSKALAAFAKADSLGNISAPANIAEMSVYGEGAATNYEKAFQYAQKAYNAGELELSPFRLATLYYWGAGVPVDYDLALKLFLIADKSGSTTAAFFISEAYGRGNGAPINPALSWQWAKRGAGLGDSDALVRGGYLLERGIGVKKDPDAAFDWYSKAAKLGNAGAMYNLGLCYSQSDADCGVKQDYRLALKWGLESAKAGYAGGMRLVGTFYELGYASSARDRATAIEWYRKAVAAGDDLAAKYLLHPLGSSQESIGHSDNNRPQVREKTCYFPRTLEGVYASDAVCY